MRNIDKHPLIQFGNDSNLSRRQVRKLLDIPESTFKQLVTGHTRASWDRASEWEAETNGKISAVDVMRWQSEFRATAA